MPILDNVKKWFGFQTKIIEKAPETLKSAFIAKFQNTPEAERSQLLTSSYNETFAKCQQLAVAAKGETGRAGIFFAQAKQQFELAVYLHQQQSREHTDFEKGYESLLGLLCRMLECYALPASEQLALVEQLEHQFAEKTFLAEARGEYKHNLSEAPVWVKFPFEFDPKIPGKTREQDKALAQVFTACPELTLLELETKVPWLEQSFLDLQNKLSSRRLALLFEPGTHKYYGYLF